MLARTFAILLGGMLLLDGLVGLVLMRGRPDEARLAAVCGAVVLALGVTWLTARAPRAAGAPLGCSACGHPRDPTLSFCVRCGR